MNKKVLDEITVAAGIGAATGIVATIVLTTEFGMVWWISLIIVGVAGIAGALIGGFSYRPQEFYQVVLAIGRQWPEGSRRRGRVSGPSQAVGCNQEHCHGNGCWCKNPPP